MISVTHVPSYIRELSCALLLEREPRSILRLKNSLNKYRQLDRNDIEWEVRG